MPDTSKREVSVSPVALSVGVGIDTALLATGAFATDVLEIGAFTGAFWGTGGAGDLVPGCADIGMATHAISAAIAIAPLRARVTDAPPDA